jgi:hypothetical protein
MDEKDRKALQGDGSKKAGDKQKEEERKKKEEANRLKKMKEKQPELVPAVKADASANLDWGKKVEVPTAAPAFGSRLEALKAGAGAGAGAGAAVPPPAPAPAPAAAAPAAAPVAGQCSQQGKVDWKKCEECGKRHP